MSRLRHWTVPSSSRIHVWVVARCSSAMAVHCQMVCTNPHEMAWAVSLMSASSAMWRRVAAVPGESGGYGGSIGCVFVGIGVGREKSGAVAPYPGGAAMGSGGGESGMGCTSGVGKRGT